MPPCIPATAPRNSALLLSTMVVAATLLGCSSDRELTTSSIVYDETAGRVIVQSDRPLAGGEKLFIHIRRGKLGQIDCAEVARRIKPASVKSGGTRMESAPVDGAFLLPFYGPEWAGEPTAEMIAAAELGTRSIIDVCRVQNNRVVDAQEVDLMVAWDAGKRDGIGGKADEVGGQVKYHSQHDYAERCVEELGEIPFFKPTGVDGEYATYHCNLGMPNADGSFPDGYVPAIQPTKIPLTTTDADGNVTNEQASVNECDKPQYIYSSCEAGPTVSSAINEEGTRWVLLCRKDKNGQWDEAEPGADDRFVESGYNDIAMIGHNPTTGKSCYFQNALYQQTDGARVPHPADDTKWQTIWDDTVHGALGSGIECAKCHDADAWIHSPWIDGAKDTQGRTIVPKMGEDPAYVLGANDAPYSIVNSAGQGWTMPQQVVSPEANACLQCHRIGSGNWVGGAKYLNRLSGDDSAFLAKTTAASQEFHKLYWMPPDLRELGLTEDNIADSDIGKALAFLQNGCPDCEFAPLPTGDVNVGGGPLYELVDLPDAELAMAAAQHLGAEVEGSTERCSECHSLTRPSLTSWLDMSSDALSGCLSTGGTGAGSIDTIAARDVALGEFLTFGPYRVPEGGTFAVTMNTESGDPDLYVKKNAGASESSYDCRPYTGGVVDESCGPSAGPGSFYIGVHGYAASRFSLKVTYDSEDGSTRAPIDVVNCMRKDPADPSSDFDPRTIGVFSAGVHLGYFQDIFRAAYPDSDAWQAEYNQFKQRVSMPKGNHPRMTQEEFNIVATWFVRGLPALAQTIPETVGSSCDPYISTDLTDHIDNMAVSGWSAKNVETGLDMFGCEQGGGGGDVDESLLSEVDLALSKDQEHNFGPFTLASGASLAVAISGTGDADLYLRKGAAPTTAAYDCRPYASSSNENCADTGPGQYFVMVVGYAASSVVNLEVTRTTAGTGGGGGSVATIDCLSSYPRVASWEYMPGAKVRQIRSLPFTTSFWTRSSADGRYVAHGGSWISDLQRDYDIPVNANYDPAFYPDNSGFIFHGTPIDGSGGAYCALSLLDDEPDDIQFEGDEECSQIANIATYQHLGKGIDEGGDYFIINSPFTSDNGGHSATHSDPSASYSDSSEIRITPMVNVGGRYEAGQVATFATPNEGDSVLSPSTQLVAGHIGDENGRPVGYVIRKVEATRTESGYEIDAPEVARICANGTKPAFSYDERFLVFHHYVEANDWAALGFASPVDPEWLEYVDKGASNLFIVDLMSGEQQRITNMPAGEFALYPHFRSDGWIYFLVREPGTNAERVGASDAALLLGNQ